MKMGNRKNIIINKFECSPSKGYDFLTPLREGFLGKIYRKYIKKYTIVQSLSKFFWQNIFPVCYRHTSILILKLNLNREMRRRSIVKLCDFAEKYNLPVYKLEDENIVETPKPIVFPPTDKKYLQSQNNYYKFPDIYTAAIKNGMIYGHSNFVFLEKVVVCHDLYDFKKDYTSEEFHGRALISPKSNSIRWTIYDKNPERVPVAATFVDACAHNYAHWLSEVLPRLILFCSDERFKNIPIVVNDGLHDNIMESVILAAGTDREVFLLPTDKALCCDQLYVISATGYVPFDWRQTKISNPSHGVFSAKALNKLNSHFQNTEDVSKNRVWPDKIFISRNSGTRRFANSHEIEKQLSKRGYITVNPEKFSFEEQVKLFSNAKTIVAPTGAGLANAIFCRPKTSLGIVMAKHERMIYRYWTNMLASRRLRIFYLLGDIVKNKGLGIHGDFIVNPKDFMSFLEAIERDNV